MLDEMPLILGESLPVLDILSQVDLLCSPERGLLVLVHLPDVMVLYGEEHEAVGVLFQEGLGEGALRLRIVGVLLRLHDLLGGLVAHLGLVLRHRRELHLRL